jgi:hypothetical protein
MLCEHVDVDENDRRDFQMIWIAIFQLCRVDVRRAVVAAVNKERPLKN